jgi:hypothetical protein
MALNVLISLGSNILNVCENKMQWFSKSDPFNGVQNCYHSVLSESAARNKFVFKETPMK